MANYNQVSRGSGDMDTVLTLQRKLNEYGAGLQEDGIFGDKTDKALRNYQSANGLQVDGIAGPKTWEKLMSGNNAGSQQTAQQAPAPTVTAEPEKSYRYDYENAPLYQAADQKEKDLKSNRPTLQGSYDEQVDQLYQEMMGQKNFEYDLNGDALWQQYKDQYTTQGKLAMMDTMGQAAALTGGYGSSYAQGAGQQAYQGYLQQLNDRVPELYQLALQKYNNDQALLKDKFTTAKGMQDDEYAKYMDATDLWYKDLGLAIDEKKDVRDYGQSEWYTGEQLRRDDENTAYTREQDAYSKVANMIATTGYVPSDPELAAAGMTRGEADALAVQYNREMELAYSSNTGSNVSADPEYVRPDVDGPEKEAFLEEAEKFGEEAAIQWAEAYNIHPAIIEAWLRSAQLNRDGDNYYDPGA